MIGVESFFRWGIGISLILFSATFLILSVDSAEKLYDGMTINDYCAKLLGRDKKSLTAADLFYCDEYYKKKLDELDDFTPEKTKNKRRDKRGEGEEFDDIPISDEILEREVLRTPVIKKGSMGEDIESDIESMGEIEEVIEEENAEESMEIEEAEVQLRQGKGKVGKKGKIPNEGIRESYEELKFKEMKELPEDFDKVGKGKKGKEEKSRQSDLEVNINELPQDVGIFDSTILPLEGKKEFTPLSDNYELVVLSVNARSIIYELPLLLPSSEEITEPFWIVAETSINDTPLSKSCQFVTTSSVSKKGGHIYLKFESPWDPYKDAVLKVSIFKTKDLNRDPTPLFSREKVVKALKKR